VENWRDATPDGFAFCPKLPQEVTGGPRAGRADLDKRGEEPTDAPEILAEFLETMDLLGPKLGPLVVQFAPSYAKKGHAKDFAGLLSAIGDRRAAFEFRHASWFEPATYKALSDRNAALVWSHVGALEVPPEATADFLLVRFIGDRSFEPAGKIVKPDDDALGKWAGRIETRAQHIDETFVFFNNHFEGFGPGSANRFLAAAGGKPADWGQALGAAKRGQTRLGEF
jgi:uncharacterized protein YecE (DUF72 family)